MLSIVGYTGFVGSNICAKKNFDGLYNSKNIKEAYGTKPDLLVFAGLPATKFLANKNPEDDLNKIYEAINNLKKISPKQIVLISTIDVYPTPEDVDEATFIDKEKCCYYGKHRLLLENFIEETFENRLIVRLPGLFGKGIKKNFIYDLIHIIPNLLNEKKYNELSLSSSLIKNSYQIGENGFYKLVSLTQDNKIILRDEFKKLQFTALNFTDSRGVFQYYDLENLWNDIKIALDHNLKKINISTEPIRVDELHHYACGGVFKNEFLDKDIPHYDFKSKYYHLYDGKNGYLYDKDSVLSSIKKFVESEQYEFFDI